MGFLAPVAGIVAGALGLGSVGTAVAQLAIGVGLSLAANKLIGKRARGSGSAQSGRQLSLQAASDAERQALFGRTATAGSLVYWHLSGANNDALRMVIALADHECEGLHTTLWVDGKEKTWNPSTKEVSGYEGKLKVFFYNGTASQSADGTLVSTSGGRWTANEKGANVCYAVVEATYDEKLFASGIPQIVFVVDGAKLYDPRKDSTAGGSGSHRWDTPSTWEWSDNPAVIVYNVLRGFRQGGQLLIGMHVPADAIRYSDFAASANACDESVTLRAGGTEKRYRCNLLASCFDTNANVLELALATMAGELIESGGIYRIVSGVSQPIVASLTDADLIVDAPFSASDRLPRSELVNAVFGTFSDPTRSFSSVPLPPRTSSAAEAEDGGIRLPVALDLVGVTSRAQAQRIMEIERKRSRRQGRVSCTLRARWVTLEPGDWIEFTSARRGWEGRVFQVVDASENESHEIEISLQEVDAGIDDWTPSTDELLDNTVVDLGPGGPSFNEITGLDVQAVLLEPDVSGAAKPALAVSWDPITDPTVVGIDFQYRKVGDTAVLEARVLDPTVTTAIIAGAVTGSTTYEVRARPLTTPSRPVNWTSWVEADQTGTETVVATALIAQSVEPNTITAAMLATQLRSEIELITAPADVQGSVAAALDRVRRDIIRTNEALAGVARLATEDGARIRREEIIRQSESESFAAVIETLTADLADASAAIVTEQSVRAAADEAIAEAITTVSTTVGDLTSSVSTIQGSVNGISAYYGAFVTSGGRTGFQKLDGTGGELTMAFGIDKLFITSPDGGADFQPFIFDTLTSTFYIDGDLNATGSISADKLNASTLHTLQISDPDDTYIFNFSTGYVGRVDGTQFWNLATGDFQIG